MQAQVIAPGQAWVCHSFCFCWETHVFICGKDKNFTDITLDLDWISTLLDMLGQTFWLGEDGGSGWGCGDGVVSEPDPWK